MHQDNCVLHLFRIRRPPRVCNLVCVSTSTRPGSRQSGNRSSRIACCLLQRAGDGLQISNDLFQLIHLDTLPGHQLPPNICANPNDGTASARD